MQCYRCKTTDERRFLVPFTNHSAPASTQVILAYDFCIACIDWILSDYQAKEREFEQVINEMRKQK
jgi:hypothetical protein